MTWLLTDSEIFAISNISPDTLIKYRSNAHHCEKKTLPSLTELLSASSLTWPLGVTNVFSSLMTLCDHQRQYCSGSLAPPSLPPPGRLLGLREGAGKRICMCETSAACQRWQMTVSSLSLRRAKGQMAPMSGRRRYVHMCESHTPTERERKTQPSDAVMASTPGA